MYFWLYEEDAHHLIDALDTHLTEMNWVLARTDTRDGQRELHRRVDRLEDIRKRLRSQFQAPVDRPPLE